MAIHFAGALESRLYYSEDCFVKLSPTADEIHWPFDHTLALWRFAIKSMLTGNRSTAIRWKVHKFSHAD